MIIINSLAVAAYLYYSTEGQFLSSFVPTFVQPQNAIESEVPPAAIRKSSKAIRLPNLVPSVRTNATRSILVWNSAHRIETAAFGFGGKELFEKQGCEFTDCEVTDTKLQPNRSLESFDAIIIQMHEIWMAPWPEFKRRPEQRLIWLSQESPQTLPVNFQDSRFDHFFNWTMTYRLNSDIQLRYGRVLLDISKLGVEKLLVGIPPADRNYAANKTRPVVWMASHCGTKSLRETYVRELSKSIPVDIYGACGGAKALSCSRNHEHWLSHPHCYDELASKYKFYFSAENSFCTDYATEKFYHILAHDMVPVVYGVADYSLLAPPHSYINALDYTPEELAAYLTELDRNDTLYNGYFWWKDHYTVEAGVEQMARHGFCDLCRKLHLEDGLVQVYPDMFSDWSWEKQCIEIPAWGSTNNTELKNILNIYRNKNKIN